MPSWKFLATLVFTTAQFDRGSVCLKLQLTYQNFAIGKSLTISFECNSLIKTNLILKTYAIYKPTVYLIKVVVP